MSTVLEDKGLVLESVTKANVYATLNKLKDALTFGDVDSENLFTTFVEENFKPQKGGGATANPPKEIDGITYHYCRCFQDYLPESEMVFSLGKCKGISQIGQKLSYNLKKQADEALKASVPLFVSGDIEGGNAKVAESKAIEAKLEDPATYVAEKERLAKLEAESQTEETTESEDLV